MNIQLLFRITGAALGIQLAIGGAAIFGMTLVATVMAMAGARISQAQQMGPWTQ